MVSSRPVDIHTGITAYGPHYIGYKFEAHGDTRYEVICQLRAKVHGLLKARSWVRIGYPIAVVVIIALWPLIAILTSEPGFYIGLGVSAFLSFVMFVRFVWPWLELVPENIERLEAEIIRLS